MARKGDNPVEQAILGKLSFDHALTTKEIADSLSPQFHNRYIRLKLAEMRKQKKIIRKIHLKDIRVYKYCLPRKNTNG